ncbi:hypothetical protein MAPG_01942 [Magnaporthiopsis poae ATCC 64411]|uniref:ATP-dependent RNA helicase n=1 Tax=Magnaporthiopsis poae (strain ATCC 64411 / 73-15) TaxID=644358 RepID=A0A0C4DQ09_MAGP6|nr:hypothetical protein MAPG_01942 [Magnaporthiopsis poae ATCC 64411]
MLRFSIRPRLSTLRLLPTSSRLLSTAANPSPLSLRSLLNIDAMENENPNRRPRNNRRKRSAAPSTPDSQPGQFYARGKTPVQAATIRHLATARGDVLAQAKTGTGKTIAFLLPAIQSLLHRDPSRGNGISLLAISPTRELALQIAKEAQMLLQRLPSIKVCTAIGGTNKNTEERQIRKGCQILVGTPGRIFDHLTAEDGGESEVRAMLQGLDTLVLDEADRLLDMGFLPSLKKIVSCLPRRDKVPRQGMLFSATVADHVAKVASIALAPNYKFISTIATGETNTHERVPQHLVVVPTFADMAAGLVGAIRHELDQSADKGASFKAIVFAPTAGLVDFYAAVFEKISGLPAVSTLHSRMSQSKRTSVTEDFRRAASGVMIATDVIARGMDFPAVSNVFQAGIPSDKESYIHRLGRTARAGAEGRGTLIVTSHETYFPRRVMKAITFIDQEADLSSREDVDYVTERLDEARQTKTYQAWLGFYRPFVKALGWTDARLVQEANIFARDGLGAPETPGLAKSTIGKMGLKGVPGLRAVPDPPRKPRGGKAKDV